MKNNEKTNNYDAGINISWASIFAGVVTFLAILFTLSLIGSAIGFKMVHPTDPKPFDNVGTGVLIWSVVAFVLSLFAGGFLSGISSKRLGLVHGFMTWATSILSFLIVLSYVATGTFSIMGSMIGNATSAVGDGTQAVISETSDVISSSFESIVDTTYNQDIDTEDLHEQVNQVLKDTDIPELQPDYLHNELEKAQNEVLQAGKDIALNPENANEIFSNTIDSLKERAQKITDSIDQSDIAHAVEENTDLTGDEAEQVVNNIYNEFQTASKEVQKEIENISDSLEEQEENLKEEIKQLEVKAEKASDTTAKASIWAFISLVLGMIITSLGGFFGTRFAKEHNEELL